MLLGRLAATAWLPGLALGWSLFSWWSRPPSAHVAAWAVDWSDSVLRESLRSIESADRTIEEIDLFRLRLTETGELSDSGPVAAPYDRLIRTASERGMARVLTPVNDVSADPPRLKDADVVGRILVSRVRNTSPNFAALAAAGCVAAPPNMARYSSSARLTGDDDDSRTWATYS